VTDFIEIRDNSPEEIIYNAMVLFRHSDLGSKIEISVNREPKKETDIIQGSLPMQSRLRLQNRFNMDLNNVYAVELIRSEASAMIETSVNVYHDDFNLDDFNLMAMDVFAGILQKVDFQYLLKRFAYNYRNALPHWKAAKEKQFIIDPEVDRMKEMYDAFSSFRELAESQLQPVKSRPVSEWLTFAPEIILEKRKLSYAKSKILKIQHRLTGEAAGALSAQPQLCSLLLLEYCLVPLFLANELYVMSLIYHRKLEDIRAILGKRVQEV